VFNVALAQQLITGNVSDSDGQPLPGATVVIKGTNTATSADFDGNYAIAAKNGDVIVVSFVGFKAVEVEVASATINVTLESSNELDEVIVVGYGGPIDARKYSGSAVQVSAEELGKKNVSTISRALIGEAVGVTVVAGSGQPGSGSTVRIRGRAGSVNGSSTPLYVLDGVPYNGSINAINPNDIASTTILKDAAATAIYGNRGANGVIIITTKRGTKNKTTVSVDVRTGTNMDYLPRYSVIESPERYTEIVWESLRNRALGLGATAAQAGAAANTDLFSGNGFNPKYNMWNSAGDALIDPATGKFVSGVTRKYTPENWRDYAFQNAARNEVNMSVSGGSDKATYYYSVGALDDVGYSINSDFRRYTTRLNVDFKPNDWITAKSNIGYSYSFANNNGQSSDSGSVFWTTANMPRIYPLFLRDADGNKIIDKYGGFEYDYGEGRGYAGLTNSIGDAVYNTSTNLIHNLNLNQNFTIKFSDELNYSSNLSYQYWMNNDDFRSDPFYGSSRGQGGYISKTKSQILTWQIRNAVTFKKEITDDLLIDAFVAHESERYESSTLNGNKYKLVQPGGLELDNAVVNNTASSSTSAIAREAVVAFMKLEFKDKYFLTADVRRDGASYFNNKKWGTFGSVAGSWIVSDEDFFNSNTFEFLKVKASFGVLGSAGGQGFYPGYDVFTVENLDGEISLAFDSKGNPDLTWEAGEQVNFGVEFKSSIVNGNIDIYQKNRKDMFFTQNVGPSVGYRSIIVNDGSLRNSGIEFELEKTLVDTGDFKLDFSVLGAYETNEITAMPIDVSTGEPKNFDSNGVYGLAEGHNVYEYYMREWAGVNPDTGYAQWDRYYDDKDSSGSFTDGDVSILDLFDYRANNEDATIGQDTVETYTDATKLFTGKTALPDLVGSFSIDAEFKRFDLQSVFTYAIGGYAYDGAYRDFMSNDSAANTQQFHTDIEDRWQNAGDITNVPLLNSNLQNNQASTSTRFLIESDYLSLANLQIGYNLPSDAVKKMKASSVRIYVSGDNLFILTKRDGFNPTYSLSGGTGRYTYEPMTTVTAGLSINF
jgi:TonB-linked SusC/RagA family outer membrane protein